MRVLIIGSGGREHALAWKLAADPGVNKIYSIPGNGGLRELADCRDLPLEPTALARFAVKEKIDLTIVGPEKPLVDGIVDVFEERGLLIFGPNKAAAQLEGSKSFAKTIMNKYQVPTARTRIFTDFEDALKYANGEELPLVIKADGLAGGKGVIIAESQTEVESALRDCFLEKRFGAAGEKVLIEEFLIGQEVSLLSFCDGNKILPMVPAQDYKRVDDDDQGLNTGGMGSYSPVPVVTEQVYASVVDTIVKPTIKGLAAEGIIYRGVLYAGVILTTDGPKVLEFNVRFGDPETQSIIPRLKSDLSEILLATAQHDLGGIELAWHDEKCVSIVLSSAGYPQKPQVGYEITGLREAAALDNVNIFQAATKIVDGKLLTNGGRVLSVSALGSSFSAARTSAYAAVELIKFKGAHFRRDIAARAEKAERVWEDFVAEPLAVVIMGSSSDAEIMSGADLMLKEFDISVDKQVISAHRNARKLADYIAKAEADGVEVIIAGAGMSAHLPGAIAALTTLPVIGVPIAGAGLGGLDALLSMVQMPSGVPVAVMAINGAKNAAILAAEILALKHSSVKKALFEYRTKLAGES